MGGSRRDPYVNLGKFIKRQRELAQLSVRQFADLCGISNPYLSQTERVIDIAGIQMLAAFSRSARIRGKQFRLIGLNKIQIDALKLAGFESLTDSNSV